MLNLLKRLDNPVVIVLLLFFCFLIYPLYFYRTISFFESEKVNIDTKISLPKNHSLRYVVIEESSGLFSENSFKAGYILKSGSCSDRFSTYIKTYDITEIPFFLQDKDYGYDFLTVQNNLDIVPGVCYETDSNGKSSLYVSNDLKKNVSFNELTSNVSLFVKKANIKYSEYIKNQQKIHEQELINKHLQEKKQILINNSWKGK